ncbi:hypothetical protein GIB67_042709 [Kingdonia uniflora]|uniref:Uncharacterized protein n=1 Tax=Kingdonia uniflora TaxID=39325 RepID=A0A7J7NDZ1_9MAGN|nr:hypothetical protein GIB67_042709 [Kingdonia uniflora]
MVIVKFPKIAVEFMVDYSNESGSRCENLLLANDDVRFPSPLSNIERLISALQDNILKHGNSSDIVCGSCFSSREAMKVGSGMLCSEDNLRSKGQEVIEVVIVILELPEPSNPSCLKACNSTTEVSYFEEFLPCLIPQSSVNSLTSIDWKSYGLSLRTNLIMIPQVRRKTQFDRNLVKKAIILAMDDLKEKYTGVLLSAHAVKIQSYVPDFAKTITGLILSSNDIDFQKECISILGLKSQDADEKKVEGCIRKKITAVIETNDRKPQRNRESAPFLFEDDRNEEPKFEDEEDAGEEDFDLLDL